SYKMELTPAKWNLLFQVTIFHECLHGKKLFPSASPIFGVPVEKILWWLNKAESIFHPRGPFFAFRLKRRCGASAVKDKNSILWP
ncbi:MAG: hypothetical protein Q4A04_08880, partial [Eubacteriales bacterium]|nr:hypothetical protein [Eubacteriales bacterium]